MADNNSRVSVFQLIAIPALITLAITILRLYGELQHWSPRFFNPAAGGGFAIVGITWLPLVFGIYFAFNLVSAGQEPQNKWAAVGHAALALLLLALAGFIAIRLSFTGSPIVALVLGLIAFFLPLRGWPALFRTLIAYGYAARIPVAVLMYFAIRGSWGTHYDVLPPGFPTDAGFWPTYFQIGLLPQLLLWIVYTVIVGSVLGTLAVALFRPDRASQHATTAAG